MLILGHTVLMYNYIQNVPHHVGSLMAILFDFLGLIRKLKKNELFRKIV